MNTQGTVHGSHRVLIRPWTQAPSSHGHTKCGVFFIIMTWNMYKNSSRQAVTKPVWYVSMKLSHASICERLACVWMTSGQYITTCETVNQLMHHIHCKLRNSTSRNLLRIKKNTSYRSNSFIKPRCNFFVRKKLNIIQADIDKIHYWLICIIWTLFQITFFIEFTHWKWVIKLISPMFKINNYYR